MLGWAEWKRKRPSLGLEETRMEQVAGKLPMDQDKKELAVPLSLDSSIFPTRNSLQRPC